MTASQQDINKDIALHDIISAFKELGVNYVLNELQAVRPTLFNDLDNYFKFKEYDRKLGILLDATLSRRERIGMEGPCMAVGGSDSDPRIKR